MTVNVIHWSRDTPIPSTRLLTAALAMAAPITYGVASNHLVHASFAALGALAAPSAGRFAAPGKFAGLARLTGTGLLVTGAAALGTQVGGHGWTTVAVIVGPAAVAAVVGGFNRWMADATTRFVTFLVMATGFGGADTWEVTRWFAAGVLWAILLALFTAAPPPPRATYRQLLRRWWRTLHLFDGWQYAVHLLPPLAIASAIGVYWHQQKSYWIALAVVIVVRRRGDSLLRATERCLGTCAGVLIGGALVLWVPPSWAIVAVVSVLAGLRPLLKERNYTAYAMIMTPLVVLLMDLGRTPELSTVGYRLVDTVLGCLLAIVPTLMLRRRNVA